MYICKFCYVYSISCNVYTISCDVYSISCGVFSITKLYFVWWDLLQTRWKVHKSILFYEIINGYSPKYLYDLNEPYRQSSHSFNLRINVIQFKIPHIRTTS